MSVKRFGSDSLLEEPLLLLFARDLTHRYWLVHRVHSSPAVDEGARPWPRGSRRGSSDGAAKNYLDHSSSPLLFLSDRHRYPHTNQPSMHGPKHESRVEPFETGGGDLQIVCLHSDRTGNQMKINHRWARARAVSMQVHRLRFSSAIF